ncbi:MAG: protein-disulfide reductase DsbD domain-containing protein [Terriglobales bacterium]
MRGERGWERLWVFGVALGMMVALTAAAQLPGVAHIQAPARVEAKAHAMVVVNFEVSVEPGFHIQSNQPKLDYIIPSTLTLTPAQGVSVAKVEWPQAQDKKFSFSPDPLAVFEGNFALPVTLKTGAAGTVTLHGVFRYQACNDQLCRPPVKQPVTLTLQVK